MLFSTFEFYRFYCTCASIFICKALYYVIVKSFELKWIYDFK